MIRFPKKSPFDAEKTKAVEEIAEAELATREEGSVRQTFLFLDASWEWNDSDPWNYQTFDHVEDFSDWFPEYAVSQRGRWEAAACVVYVEETAEELIFHFIISADEPIHALVVNLASEEAEWVEAYGPKVSALAEAKTEAESQ